jgi:hypothetical protein
MKREHLTNVETEAQCQELAHDAMMYSKWIVGAKNDLYSTLRRNVTGQVVADKADRIIALRSQQVTP